MPRATDDLVKPSWETAQHWAEGLAGRWLDARDRLAAAIAEVERLNALDEENALADLIEAAAGDVAARGGELDQLGDALESALMGLDDGAVSVRHAGAELLVAIDDDADLAGRLIAVDRTELDDDQGDDDEPDEGE